MHAKSALQNPMKYVQTLFVMAGAYWGLLFQWIIDTLPIAIVQWIDLATLLPSWALRLVAGEFAAAGVHNCQRPTKTIILYEFEWCPYCKKVREALSTLDLDYVCYPCPRTTFKARNVTEGSRYCPVAQTAGGKAQFPLLIDDNTGTKMYESAAIVQYLWDTYGKDAQKPLTYKIASSPYYEMPSLMISGIFRPLWYMGMLKAPSTLPEKHLELWGMEPSPFVKRVREVLSSLELPYLMHTTPVGSSKREIFKKLYGDKLPQLRKSAGLIKVPFLYDPNTGKEMFESLEIVKYLMETYKSGPAPTETLFDYVNFLKAGDKKAE
ncbi:unnamed protein product [Vitrella brassicaformis CCMP3155]|uniref:GST N-terminal domain-containing protein n=1 Tax=Vitrella brassicaformis (strain CCMP3155) TaxID=1169540 RepID=A0A0G4EWS6_VITBC|nr:unnamed protein product [Vitrella brassicaformis CCMP3155]|eukprot:CEM02524.1 unnamed protein product [Vitrella brassicaformis CCMP3155]